MRFFALLIPLLWLSACQTPLQYLHSLDPQANDFESSLAAEYLAYSDSEKEQGRQAVAEYFAVKGVKATNGEPVEPEKPAAHLPKATQKKLLAARHSLLGMLTDDMKRVSPQKTARAQLLFDCWAHQENMHLNKDGVPCAGEFQSTLADLQPVADSFVHARVTPYAVQFATGSTELNEEAKTTIGTVVASVSATADYKIKLSGSADKRKSSRALLDQRFAALREALVAQGIEPGRITLKHDNNSKVVKLSSDVVQNPDQVDIMLKTFGMAEEPAQ